MLAIGGRKIIFSEPPSPGGGLRNLTMGNQLKKVPFPDTSLFSGEMVSRRPLFGGKKISGRGRIAAFPAARGAFF